MMKTYGNTYIFEWIDLLVSQVLNPQKEDFQNIDSDQLNKLSGQIQQESYSLYARLTNQFFSLTKPGRQQHLIRQYHSTLTLLYNQVLLYKKHESFQRYELKNIIDLVESCLEELLSLISSRYSTYLTPEGLISAPEFEAFQQKIMSDTFLLKEKFTAPYPPAMALVLSRLNRLLASSYEELKITYRTVSYKQILIKGLLETDPDSNSSQGFTEIDKLLIYLNFNSKTYIKLLTAQLEDKLKSLENSKEKLSTLKSFYKVFSMIHPKPKAILNPQYYDLQTIIEDWFRQEFCFHKEVAGSHETAPPASEFTALRPSVSKHKIVCHLSTDQIALILRAADESGILQARSLNEVFKSIVPHLSTPRKKDLSYSAVRNRIYNVEQIDKEIAIQTLQKMIHKIQDY